MNAVSNQTLHQLLLQLKNWRMTVYLYFRRVVRGGGVGVEGGRLVEGR